jgi:hypothetical protein
MPSINNLYIDEIYIISNTGGTLFADVDNLLSYGGSHDGEGVTWSKSLGLKWVVQVTNGTGSTYTPNGTNRIILNLCVNYNNDDDDKASYDYFIQYESTTSIPNGGSIYFGWTGNGVTIVSSGLTYSDNRGTNSGSLPAQGAVYLPDQRSTGSGLTGDNNVYTRFTLFTNNTSSSNRLDRIGNISHSNGVFSTNPIPFLINSGSLPNTTGSLRRKIAANLSQNAPTTSFSTSDWNTSTGTSHLSVSAAGDPHITTLSGEHYKFEYLGAFRLLEDEIDGETLIINGCSEHGKARWSHNEYIKKLYIKHGEKYIYMDTGFRGEAVKVLEESGFLYTKNNLPFNKHAKRYSITDCNKTATKEDNMSVTTDLPGFVRNQINFTIDNKDGDTVLLVSVENVNEYNLQPCRLLIKLGKISLLKNAKGCLIDRKYAPVCKLDNIKCMKSLEEPSLEDLKNIPELEFDPQLQNIKWK